jgi:hypothetical protein
MALQGEVALTQFRLNVWNCVLVNVTPVVTRRCVPSCSKTITCSGSFWRLSHVVTKRTAKYEPQRS